ncbi:hypothetical protein K493DRAFT_334145 [Basidiobolus meristosporus CBS 931.73]|uniref:RING-type domain-containing protein n=1 Tax=Basidiobolus meristosporus CBS 931.73 TaxID=1314790 RepID=A0A1Y1Z0Y6_9FUNG|nr:hypothetical protein K493DRAFT_334145 [Basidiobolus meristosporus CBS 931.73]|eukprot:ORY03784.1 hypothetical protein K493DRAFT_334145 [Basidiobolus meristosporus CBS 931.73]
MGNVNTKKEDESVDGGGFVPYGVYSGPQDFDHRVVKKLIQERRLAAFYKGLPDLDSLKTLPSSNHPHEGTKHRSGSVKSRDSTAKLTMADLYRGAVECPICFLYYPRNINFSRCCEQPICTECFVQIKRPEATGTPAVCPFCVRPHFGVLYKPPQNVMFYLQGPSESQSTSHNISTDLRPTMPNQNASSDSNDEDHRRKSVNYNHPDVVTSDDIRPDYARRLEIQARTIANAARLLSGEGSNTSRRLVIPRTPSGSNRNPSGTHEHNGYLRHMGGDLEEMMVMEAIRQSIIEEQEREERERHEKQAQREAREALQRQNKTATSSPPGETAELHSPEPVEELENGVTNLDIHATECPTDNESTSEPRNTTLLEDPFADPDVKNPVPSNEDGPKEAV